MKKNMLLCAVFCGMLFSMNPIALCYAETPTEGIKIICPAGSEEKPGKNEDDEENGKNGNEENSSKDLIIPYATDPIGEIS